MFETKAWWEDERTENWHQKKHKFKWAEETKPKTEPTLTSLFAKEFIYNLFAWCSLFPFK